MEWPDYFPENCPPENTNSGIITVYILVHSPIESGDFLSLRERLPNDRFADPEFECQAHGVSVFGNIEHVKNVRDRVPRLRSYFIGVGTLKIPDMGIFKPTPSKKSGQSHCTWWIPLGLNASEVFQVLEEG